MDQVAAVDWSVQAASAAAEDRIRSCRDRLRRLRADRLFDEADATLARDSLARARARYAAAEKRRRVAAILLAAQRQASKRQLVPAGMRPEVFASRMAAHGVTAEALAERYLSLGGACSAFDIDGYVHGVMQLPAHELGLLDHALWELTELPED